MNVRPNIVGIDFLRFTAALLVSLYHVAFMEFLVPHALMPKLLDSYAVQQSFGSFFSFGWIGVQIFFVISGFVIAYSAERATAFSFFKSRFVRLYPAVWIFCVIAFFSAILVREIDITSALKMAVRSAVISPLGPWLESVLWTLPNEISFYSVIFLTLILNRFRLAHFPIYFIGAVSSLYWCFYFYCYIDPDLTQFASSLRAASWSWKLQLSLVHFGCFFALGFALWRWLLKGHSRVEFYVMPLLLIGCLIEISGKTAEDMAATGKVISAWPGYIAWTILLIAMIVSIRFHSTILQAVGRIPNGVMAARQTGLMTYNLYLLHMPVTLLSILGLRHIFGPSSLVWGVGFTMALLSAWIITLYVEPVVQKAVKRVFELFPSRRLQTA